MAALLILGGFLLIALSILWLIVLAFQVGILWGVGSLLPPVLLVFVMRYWRVARKAVLLAALGCVPLIAGFTQLYSTQPERVEALLNLSWLQTAEDASGAEAISLNGDLYGEPFKPQYGEFINGVLMLREGDGFFAQRELRITVPQQRVTQELSALRLDVLPQDKGELPEVEIMWRHTEQRLPETRRISGGYTLHLDVLKQSPNVLQGGFHLVLPRQFKTSMSGEVQLLTDHLHYIAGQVDRQFDALSTLEYVLSEYYQRRYRTEQVHVEPLPSTVTFSAPLELTAVAQINGVQHTEPVRLLKSAEQGWYVQGDQYPEWSKQPEKERAATLEPEQQVASVENQTEQAVDRRSGFSLQHLLANPAQYQHVQVHVQTVQGNQINGRFMHLNEHGALVISRALQAPGRVTFTLMPAEVERIRLLEP